MGHKESDKLGHYHFQSLLQKILHDLPSEVLSLTPSKPHEIDWAPPIQLLLLFPLVDNYLCKCLIYPTHPLEEEMATHSSVLAWKIPWTEELGGLQSMELDTTQ